MTIIIIALLATLVLWLAVRRRRHDADPWGDVRCSQRRLDALHGQIDRRPAGPAAGRVLAPDRTNMRVLGTGPAPGRQPFRARPPDRGSLPYPSRPYGLYPPKLHAKDLYLPKQHFKDPYSLKPQWNGSYRHKRSAYPPEPSPLTRAADRKPFGRPSRYGFRASGGTGPGGPW